MIILSVGMFLIALWSRKKILFVPGVLAAVWPGAIMPSLVDIVFNNVSFVKGLFVN